MRAQVVCVVRCCATSERCEPSTRSCCMCGSSEGVASIGLACASVVRGVVALVCDGFVLWLEVGRQSSFAGKIPWYKT